VHLFDVAVARNREHLICEGQGFSPENLGVDRLVKIPYLRPAFARRLAEARWMFAAHEVPVGVVVDLQQVPTPKHDHRKLGGEREVHYRPKAPSPVLDGSKGCLRPLVDTHERCCFIAPDWPRGYGWKVGDVT